MNKKIIICILFLSSSWVFSQDKLIKDIDFDGKNDTIQLRQSMLVCHLSTLNYKPIKSKPIALLNTSSGVESTKNGFQFYNNGMRWGYKTQFRFNPKNKQIELIGMSRYELGNAANDGSGESSVNLLTKDYIGHWNFYNLQQEKLIKLPTIQTKMHLNVMPIQSFSHRIYEVYAEECYRLYAQQKNNALHKD